MERYPPNPYYEDPIQAKARQDRFYAEFEKVRLQNENKIRYPEQLANAQVGLGQNMYNPEIISLPPIPISMSYPPLHAQFQANFTDPNVCSTLGNPSGETIDDS